MTPILNANMARQNLQLSEWAEMFMLIGLGIAAAIIFRRTHDQVRQYKRKGEPGAEDNWENMWRGSLRIESKGALLGFIPVALGYGLDVLLGTTVNDLFG